MEDGRQGLVPLPTFLTKSCFFMSDRSATLIFFLAMLAWWPTAWADVSQAALSHCAQLEVLPPDHDRVDQLYLGGKCALDSQHYRQAIQLFEELVRLDGNPVFRAELGRAYLGAQEFERAREQFLLALESNPPENARQLLHTFLQMADQNRTQAREWFATASLGYQYDSNVNNGPKRPEITLFGLPFTMSPDSMPKSDRALHGTLSVVNVRPVGDRIAWQTDGVVDVLRYDSLSRFDTKQAYVDTGPHLTLGKGETDMYLPVAFSYITLGGLAYSKSLAFSPQITQQATESDRLVYSANISRRVYTGAADRDMSARQVGIVWRHTLANKWTVEPSLSWGGESARNDVFSNVTRSVGLALRGSPVPGLRFSAETSYGLAHYRGTESWADTPRRDRRFGYNLSLSKELGDGYYLGLSLSNQDTSSNLGLYATERKQMQAQLSKSF